MFAQTVRLFTVAACDCSSWSAIVDVIIKRDFEVLWRSWQSLAGEFVACHGSLGSHRTLENAQKVDVESLNDVR